MPDYTITVARSARKELQNLPAKLIQRIVPRIDALAIVPRPPDSRKIKGKDDLWRIRIGTTELFIRLTIKLKSSISFAFAIAAKPMNDGDAEERFFFSGRFEKCSCVIEGSRAFGLI